MEIKDLYAEIGKRFIRLEQINAEALQLKQEIQTLYTQAQEKEKEKVV